MRITIVRAKMLEFLCVFASFVLGKEEHRARRARLSQAITQVPLNSVLNVNRRIQRQQSFAMS